MRYAKPAVLLVLLLCFVFSPIFSRTALGKSYSYFSQYGYYGIRATITTPSGPPYTANSDTQSHSVSTTVAPWVQAGWYYYPATMLQPLRYYEYFEGGQIRQRDSLPQPWGTEVRYEVSQDGSQNLNRWCMYIGGAQIRCEVISCNAPCTVVAQSEDNINPATVFFTNFKNIEVRHADDDDWDFPTLPGHMGSDNPYRYTITDGNSFQTWSIGNSLPAAFDRSLP